MPAVGSDKILLLCWLRHLPRVRKYPKSVKILAMFVENGEAQPCLPGGKRHPRTTCLAGCVPHFSKSSCLHGCLGSDKMGRVASQSPWLVVLDKDANEHGGILSHHTCLDYTAMGKVKLNTLEFTRQRARNSFMVVFQRPCLDFLLRLKDQLIAESDSHSYKRKCSNPRAQR